MLSPSLSLKDRISSPLEAGHSIADGYQLPNRVTSALEYASKRLARKDTSVTLIAVQREYQLPANRLPPSSSLASPLWSQLRAEASGNRTPTRHTFASSAFSTLKQLIRSSVTTEPPIRERIVHIVDTRDTVISPALSDISASSASTASTALTSDSLFSSHRLRWPTTPAYDSEPPTPATPFTVASSMSMSATETGSTVSGLGLADEFGARFVYVGDLTPRDERVLSMTMEKTARKFSIGQDWLPTPLSPALLGLSPDVVQRSVAQNEVLFAADGLVVLSLDHLYTFRTALQSYASTRSATRLEDAVDELRRLVLASPGRRRLRKSALVGTYRWLEGVSEEALGDVVRMYGRAYGGDGGVEDDTVAPPLGVDVDVVAAGMEGEVVTPTVRSVKTGFGGGEGVVGPGEDSPRMVPPEEEKGEDDFEQGVGQPEMDAIEAWYRQVRLQPIEDEPVSPLADSAITPKATPVTTPKVARFFARGEDAGVSTGEAVSPLAETAVTPRATPVSTPMVAQFPARGEEVFAGTEVAEARELSTTPKPTPKPVQDVGAERVAAWFSRTTPKPSPSPPQEVKTIDAETVEARRLSTTPKPTPAPVQGATTEVVGRRLGTTPKPTPTLLIIPKPIRATIQQARTTTTDPYAPQPEEHHQPNTTPTAPLPSTPVPEPQPPLSNTTLPSPATPQPPSATSPHNHHTTPTPNLSPPPHPSRNRNRHSPLQAAGGGRERSPVLRLQTNFTSPSPRGSPQPVSALSFASSTTEGTGGSPVGLTPPTPEDLTTAVRVQQPTWWDGGGGMGLSIEEVMRSPVTAVEMGKGGGGGGMMFNMAAAMPLTPMPVTPLSAIPGRLGGRGYGPLTPMVGGNNTPRYQQQPGTPRFPLPNHGMWGGGMLSPATPRQPGSALWNGPMTPNGYDDISPITRGEWGFLMGGGAGAVGRQGGVGRVDVEGEGGE